jgi:hypothetical protein
LAWHGDVHEWASHHEIQPGTWIKYSSGYIRLGELFGYFRELPEGQAVTLEPQSPAIDMEALFEDAANRASALGCTADEARSIEAAKRFFQAEHLSCAHFCHRLFETLYTHCAANEEPGLQAAIELPFAFAAPSRSFDAGELSVPVATHAMALQELAIQILFTSNRRIWIKDLVEAVNFGWMRTPTPHTNFFRSPRTCLRRRSKRVVVWIWSERVRRSSMSSATKRSTLSRQCA